MSKKTVTIWDETSRLSRMMDNVGLVKLALFKKKKIAPIEIRVSISMGLVSCIRLVWPNYQVTVDEHCITFNRTVHISSGVITYREELKDEQPSLEFMNLIQNME